MPSQTSNSARRSAQGFTLAELMVTVAIIGILSSIAIVITGNEWRRERVNTVALELAGWLEQIRNTSLRETNSATGSGGCQITISPISSQPAGAVLAIVTPASCAAESTIRISGFATTSDRYSTATSNGDSLTFTPRGSVITPGSDNFDIRILLDGSNVMRCVRVIATLGSIRIGRNDSASSASSTCPDATFGARF